MIDRANPVWAIDITDVTDSPMACGWVYLCAIIERPRRRVVSHRVSIHMDPSFCLEALEQAFAKCGQPEVFNTAQGSPFTRAAFNEALKARGVPVSTDGKGHCKRRPTTSANNSAPMSGPQHATCRSHFGIRTSGALSADANSQTPMMSGTVVADNPVSQE